MIASNSEAVQSRMKYCCYRDNFLEALINGENVDHWEVRTRSLWRLPRRETRPPICNTVIHVCSEKNKATSTKSTDKLQGFSYFLKICLSLLFCLILYLLYLRLHKILKLLHLFRKQVLNIGIAAGKRGMGAMFSQSDDIMGKENEKGREGRQTDKRKRRSRRRK